MLGGVKDLDGRYLMYFTGALTNKLILEEKRSISEKIKLSM